MKRHVRETLDTNQAQPGSFPVHTTLSLADVPGSSEGTLTSLPAKPYIVIHLESSDSDCSVNGEAIVKCVNKFMGDTHAIIFTGYYRSPYLEEIVQAISHSEFHDMVGQLSSEAMQYVIEGADAVATVNAGIYGLADRMGIPVLLFDATTSAPLKPRSQHGYQLGLMDTPSTPYRICDALAYMVSFSAKRPALGDYLV